MDGSLEAGGRRLDRRSTEVHLPHRVRLLQVRGSWGSGQDPASHIPPLVSEGETFARLGLPSGPSELMSELQWPIFPSAHTPSPLPLLFSLLSAFFFFFFLPFLSYYYERHLSANSFGDFICSCSAPPSALPHLILLCDSPPQRRRL